MAVTPEELHVIYARIERSTPLPVYALARMVDFFYAMAHDDSEEFERHINLLIDIAAERVAEDGYKVGDLLKALQKLEIARKTIDILESLPD